MAWTSSGPYRLSIASSTPLCRCGSHILRLTSRHRVRCDHGHFARNPYRKADRAAR